jgi:hypothetical protein
MSPSGGLLLLRRVRKVGRVRGDNAIFAYIFSTAHHESQTAATWRIALWRQRALDGPGGRHWAPRSYFCSYKFVGPAFLHGPRKAGRNPGAVIVNCNFRIEMVMPTLASDPDISRYLLFAIALALKLDHFSKIDNS